jgi:hypothetical protein
MSLSGVLAHPSLALRVTDVASDGRLMGLRRT